MSTQTGTLTFDLTDPDARRAFLLASRASNMLAAVQEFDQYLRDEIKYKNPKLRDGAESIRARLHEIMSEEGITIHE